MADRIPVLNRDAVLSDDGLYRYALTRSWRYEPPVLFVMLNPSTADAEIDDPTIRRCIGFAQAWGAGGLSVANLFAYRATDPRVLSGVADPVGPENDAWTRRLAKVASRVIVAWGAEYAHCKRATDVVSMLREGGHQLYALRVTANGAPGHPLYVPRDATPQVWRP